MSLPTKEQVLKLFQSSENTKPTVDPAERPGTPEYYRRQQERLRQDGESTIAALMEADQSRHK